MIATRASVWTPVVIAGLAAVVVAVLGASMTDLGPWYRSLEMPGWKPPDWLFGPAWTVIFALAAMAGYTAWRTAADGVREWIIGLFALNGFLNILWSALFFRIYRPDWALYELALLWLSIAVLIVTVSRSSRSAAWLLAPYLAWVSFAGALNAAVVRVNAPF